MTVMIDLATDGVRLPLPRDRVVRAARAVLRAERVRNARLSITFVSTLRIAALNRRHLGHRGATDVISFGFATDVADAPIVGDIYIAPDVARKNAAAHGVPTGEEITRLVIHGILHVLGFDHPEGTGRTASRMWKRQETLLHALRGKGRARKRPGRRTRSAA
jgi:probable rRNA maturation factor